MSENIVAILRTAEEAEPRYLRATRFYVEMIPTGRTGVWHACPGFSHFSYIRILLLFPDTIPPRRTHIKRYTSSSML